MNLSVEALSGLVAWAQGQAAIRELWLFGSRARCDNGPDSDADLAVRLIAESGQGLGIYTSKADRWLAELRSSANMAIDLELLGFSVELDEIVSREGVLLWQRGADTEEPASP